MSGYIQELRDKVGHDLLLLPSAAVVVLNDQRRLLMGRHADRNIWVTPGGLIEPGESPADAAVRETWEETGLVVELTSVLGVYGGPQLIVEYANGDRACYVATVFRGRAVGGELRPDESEILEVGYFSRQEVSAMPHSRWIDIALPVIFADHGHTDFQPSSWRPSDR